jgi:hypothetical protein
MVNYFSIIYGLITKADPTTENGGLFFAHYLVLRMMLGYQVSPYDQVIYATKMSDSFIDYGLYLRDKTRKDVTVSQDEITGFFVSSHILKTTHRFSIWNTLIKHLGSYPATGATKFYNPGSYYSWAVLGDSKLSFIFAPWYTINLLISSNKPKSNTSTKLLYLNELYLIKDLSWYGDLLWQYYEWRMQVMYGEKWVAALFDIYFASEEMNHPLRELSHKI